MLLTYINYDTKRKVTFAKVLSPVFINNDMVTDFCFALKVMVDGKIYMRKDGKRMLINNKYDISKSYDTIGVLFQNNNYNIMITFNDIFIYIQINNNVSKEYVISISNILSKTLLQLCTKWDPLFSVSIQKYEDNKIIQVPSIITKGENKLIFSKTCQNILYAVPVDVEKDGNRLGRRAGFYYTENARKIMTMRNSEISGLTNGCSIQGFNIFPIYFTITERILPVFNNRKEMHKVMGEEADVCYCTLKELTNNTNQIGSFHHDANKIMYGDGIFFLEFNPEITTIGDFYSVL